MNVRDKIQIDVLRNKTDKKLQALKLQQAISRLNKLEQSYETLANNIIKQQLLIRRLSNEDIS